MQTLTFLNVDYPVRELTIGELPLRISVNSLLQSCIKNGPHYGDIDYYVPDENINDTDTDLSDYLIRETDVAIRFEERLPEPVENILKIADIHKNKMQPETLEYLSAMPTYRDQFLKEDIFNIHQILENIEQGECQRPTQRIITEINGIIKVLNSVDCSYLRIIS